MVALRKTAAFVPSSFSVLHRSSSAMSTILRIRNTGTSRSVTPTFSSLTVPQFQALSLQKGQGSNVPELISELSTLARQTKQNKLSELSSKAAKIKKQNKERMSTQPPPPLSIKRQVSIARKARKEFAMDMNYDGVNGFSEINVPLELVTRLDEMGIVKPTPIQIEAIPHAMNGRDVMGLAQTGTGKTLAFGLPLISQIMRRAEGSNGYRDEPTPKAVRSLVLVPTRELANQIAVHLGTLTQDTPISTSVVVGGQNINAQMNKLKAGTDLLVATPGRLIDLMDRGALSLKDTKFLVLDEADLMLDMGFLPSLRKIAEMLPRKRQTMLFSATMPKNMNVMAKSYLKDPVRIEVARAGKTADKITQELHFVAKAEKTQKLIKLLGNPLHREDRAIVFGRTKHGMEKLSKKLISVGIQAGSIHGNKSQPQRDRAIAAFKTGEIKVLVATDVAARGLDIPDVKRVYNYELPNVPEAYVHRIGRTARAGKTGAAIALCSVEEMDDLNDIQSVTGLEIPVVSGTPWTKHDTKQAKDKIKANKLDQQKKLRENKNRKKNDVGSSKKQKTYRGGR